MSQNLLPAQDLSEDFAVSALPARAPQDLHARLLSAFSPNAETSADAAPNSEMPAIEKLSLEEPPIDTPAINVIDATRMLAAGTLRQGEDWENFQERVVRLEHGPDVGLIRENVRDLSEALLQITLQTQKDSTEAAERFESLSDMMALLSGHMATHRQEVQTTISATGQLSQQLAQLQEEIAGQRAEMAQVKDLLLSTGQSLRHDLDALKGEFAPLNGKLEAQALTIGAIEGHIAALPGFETGLASLTVRVNNLEPGAASLATRMQDLESDSKSLNGRLDAQNHQVAAIETRIAPLPELESSLTSMASQLDGLDSDITALTGRTGILETCGLSMTARADKLESVAASLNGRVNDLDYMKGTMTQLAADGANVVERVSLIADDLEAAKGQVSGLEDAAAALADSSIRSSEGLSMLGNALEAAKTQIFSLNQTSEYLTERLRIAEQVVESFTRREKILAELHSRAAQALQVGQ